MLFAESYSFVYIERPKKKKEKEGNFGGKIFYVNLIFFLRLQLLSIYFGRSSFDLQSLDHMVLELNSNEQPFEEVHRTYCICVGEHVPPNESDISKSFLLRA